MATPAGQSPFPKHPMTPNVEVPTSYVPIDEYQKELKERVSDKPPKEIDTKFRERISKMRTSRSFFTQLFNFFFNRGRTEELEKAENFFSNYQIKSVNWSKVDKLEVARRIAYSSDAWRFDLEEASELLAQRNFKAALGCLNRVSVDWDHDSSELHFMKAIAQRELGMLADANESLIKAYKKADWRSDMESMCKKVRRELVDSIVDKWVRLGMEALSDSEAELFVLECSSQNKQDVRNAFAAIKTAKENPQTKDRPLLTNEELANEAYETIKNNQPEGIRVLVDQLRNKCKKEKNNFLAAQDFYSSRDYREDIRRLIHLGFAINRQLGDRKLATECLRYAAELDTYKMFELADFLVGSPDSSDVEEGLKIFEDMLKYKLTHQGHILYLAQEAVKNKNYALAEKYFKFAIKINPDNEIYWGLYLIENADNLGFLPDQGVVILEKRIPHMRQPRYYDRYSDTKKARIFPNSPTSLECPYAYRGIALEAIIKHYEGIKDDVSAEKWRRLINYFS